MKKLAIYFSVIIGLATLSQSCKKDSTSNPVIQTITETIRVNQAYQFDLGNFGDEEGAYISKQANYFSVSSVDREVNTGKIIYKYTPATNFVGTDQVEIKSARGSNGSSANNKIVLTTIKLTVTN